MQRAWAEVDLAKLSQNIREIKAKLRPGTEFMAVVKADAYGHGAVEVSKTALAAGAVALGVAWVAEGVQLREAGIHAPILVLSEPVSDLALQYMVDLGLEATVYSLEFAQQLNQVAQRSGKTIDVHVKLDTGMGRVGATAEEALELIRWLTQESSLCWKGLYTHFACADEPENQATLVQINRLEVFIKTLAENGLVELQNAKLKDRQTGRPILLHAANSAGTHNFPQSHFDMVRVGLDMYQDVLNFNTRVAMVKTVEAGQPLSYGGIYVTSQRTRIATLSAGYADGVDRLLSNRGQVLIKGHSYPIVGRVTMDMILVDLGPDALDVKRGDEATLIGKSGNARITMDDLAQACGTIPYEIMCGIGKRVPRIYS